jgi:serine/threonine-protein kinase
MNRQVISGRYELEEIIGTGGMSVVYKAWDLKYDRRVAVKVLRPELDADADFIRRFNQEAQAASRVSHPNIVDMYDVGRDGTTRYIVMEYVDGRTLKELIRQSGRIRPQLAVQIALRILAAADHAHHNHIVHRDIKPQNILVTDDGTIKVADFGIARSTTQNTMTEIYGNVMGSVHYFSPEQASGLSANDKSDLYSVGVVFYEMVTGSVPFDGENPVSVAYKHVNEQPPSAMELCQDISVGLNEVIAKSLQKSANLRYQSAAEMAGDLKRAIKQPEGGFIKEPAPELSPEEALRAQKAKRWRRRFKIILVLFAILLLAAACVYAFRWYENVINEVEVPSLTFLINEEALEQLGALELNGEIIERRYDDTVPEGSVIDQSHAYGAYVRKNTIIGLTLSLGKELVLIPDVVGKMKTEAGFKLGEHALKVKSPPTVIQSSAKPGVVLKQDPPAGEWIAPNTEITLTVSGEVRVMPDVLDVTLDEAEAVLIKNGFKMGKVTEKHSDIIEAGLVIEQSVPAGEDELVGIAVDLAIAYNSPKMYSAEIPIIVEVERDGDIIRCVLDESTEEAQELYNKTHNAGKTNLVYNFQSPIEGEHRLTIYVADVLTEDKTVDFSEPKK